MKKFLSLILALCLIMSISAVALAEENPTFTVAIVRWTEVWGTDFTETALLKEIGEATGVNIEWQPYWNGSWGDQKALMLASGLSALPDAFFGSISLTDADIIPNLDYFVDLTDLIPEYMPNLTAIFEKDPDLKALCTDADGRIYTLPKKLPMRPVTANELYINKVWLDELGLDLPTTYTELADTLVAFSNSGEGRYGYIAASTLQNDLNNLLLPFGVQASRAGNFMGINADGQPYFVPAAENYKEAVKWAHDLYAAGALDPEYFTQTSDMVRAKVQDTEAGSRTGIVFAWTADSELLGNAKDYVVLEAVAGPDGNRYVESDPTFLNYGKNEFVITKNCSDPGKLLTWADQFYTDEASLQTYYGSIGDGKIAKNDDGTYEVLLPAEDSGINLDTSCWTFSFRDHGPKYMNEEFESKVILPTTEGDGIKLADDAVNAAYVRDTFPVVAYTAEELDELAFLSPDITSYANQQYAHWVTEGGVDEEWDAYIAQLNQMGLEDLVNIHLGAYARYIGE
ncbi:MAG: extracellular solute-binding protein [Clostridia bacterium]|nr:extracellular solute-binding protein [Clostridia bacterium]MBR1686784.1 extracellular solute-binding protein [Clostridia bacterium]